MLVCLSDIILSDCVTHHLVDGNPLYEKRFQNVLKYHEPGFAPVLDEEGAYHIDLTGIASYQHRFVRTFGFYQNRAAVETSEGWGHILPNGDFLYPEKYEWCGNFQEGFCPVRNSLGDYFHLTLEGIPLYPERYAYVGDFKEGCAVVCDKNGQHTHIDKRGRFTHSKRFNELDVFHKGYARARDDKGWVHINKEGNFLYEERYASIEPFYNGIAYGEDFLGRLILINEQGKIIKVISEFQDSPNKINELSSEMVGFWKTWALYAAIDLKVLDILPASLTEVANKTSISLSKLKRLFKALWEMDVVTPCSNDYWDLTEKGQLLIPTSKSFMAAAGLMWGRVNESWKNIVSLLKNPQESYHISFKEAETESHWIEVYNRALDGYSQKDFKAIAELPIWKDHNSILGVGRCSVTFVPYLLKTHKHLNAKVLETKQILADLQTSSASNSSFTEEVENQTDSCPAKADAIIFPRFLH